MLYEITMDCRIANKDYKKWEIVSAAEVEYFPSVMRPLPKKAPAKAPEKVVEPKKEEKAEEVEEKAEEPKGKGSKKTVKV